MLFFYKLRGDKVEISRWNIEKNFGYKPITTFWEDFSIAEKFGIDAIKNTDKLCATGFTVLMALSRKSSIGQMTGREVHERLSGTLTADILSVQKGAKIIRVHDISPAIDSLKVMKFIQ